MGDSPGGRDAERPTPRVGVVGAGITGLSLVHYLAERGIDAVAYEAADEPGGVVDSRVVDGRVLEVGPQRLRLTPSLEAMVDALDLRRSLRTADDDLPLYVYAGGSLRVVPRSPSAFLTTDLLSPTAKLRVLAEPLTADGDPEESVADLFSRKFGREAYENLVEPILGGTYGSNPARMPAGYAIEPILQLERKRGNLLVAAAKRLLGSSETPPPASFDEGLQELPRALADAHDDRVELGTRVATVRERGEGSEGGDALVLETADGETERFDRLVSTAPARPTAAILEDVAPDAADALSALTYNPLALVHLASDADAAGFGYQVRRSEPLRTLGVSWNASLFDRDGVYTAFLGGMDDPDVLDLPEEDIGDIAAREFERVMDASAEVIHVETMPDAFPAYDESWGALEGLELPDGVSLATNYTARMGIPSRVREAKRLAGRFAEEAVASEDGENAGGSPAK